MNYDALNPNEQSVARSLVLDRLNREEARRAAEAGRKPRTIVAASAQFHAELSRAKFDRHTDEFGISRVFLL